MSKDAETKILSNVVRIDEEPILDHLGKIVRGSLEVTLNAAARSEHTETRRDTRAGPMSTACTCRPARSC